MSEAFDGDPDHGAPGARHPRGWRALQHADALGLAVPTLRALVG